MASEEIVLGIRESDVKRWEDEISDLLNIPNFLSNTYYALFGIGATALFSLLPLYLVNASPWFISFYLFAAIFFILLGVIIAIFDYKNYEQKKSKSNKLKGDIRKIVNQLKKK